jgi:hypothetical protein
MKSSGLLAFLGGVRTIRPTHTIDGSNSATKLNSQTSRVAEIHPPRYVSSRWRHHSGISDFSGTVRQIRYDKRGMQDEKS